MDVFWSWPPVTRTITVAALTISVLGYTNLFPLYHSAYIPQTFFKFPPQLWRLASSFLITNPKFGIFMDPYFLFTYGSDLEKGSVRFSEPGSFFIYTIFVCSVIIGLAGHVLGAYKFLDALIMAYAYTYSQDNPNRKVTFYIVTFDARYLPYALLVLTMVMASPEAAAVQATGLVAAHLYDFLTRIWPTFGGGRNLVVTPAFVKGWFGGNNPAGQSRPYGMAFQGRTDQSAGTSTGWSNQRGPGRRLG